MAAIPGSQRQNILDIYGAAKMKFLHSVMEYTRHNMAQNEQITEEYNIIVTTEHKNSQRSPKMVTKRDARCLLFCISLHLINLMIQFPEITYLEI